MVGARELTPVEYKMLSECAEMIVDCAWCLAHGMHPHKTQAVIRSRDALRFPPSRWPNRLARKTAIPFNSYPNPLHALSSCRYMVQVTSCYRVQEAEIIV
ncbi:hypothetical protein T310_6225 [Rasamsonia emersonii CBS 393.64]|uniref:Uncharacterized protein n=1 Tax=Rasamsonia emersonii (strain ATCC 16479 / CBS 393.64 / IMI 116815) TaxID=1408163 RepID=A0A0F4YNY7_RASE3|nr:hypothetical protein T310_6225 [Rasamsonia emersonii CBS 393.64]KKA19800.1 hypothetical protein T310_6225 [Rasamsonia emersonii CBS 393.64]